MPAADVLRLAPEVGDALAAGGPVVALESTLLSHGLPADTGGEVARQIEAAVRERGAVPATIAVFDGEIRVGLDDAAIDRIAGDPTVVKASLRDLAPVLATQQTGASTVASTAWVAHQAGIGVFATGGIGGVHRGAAESWDESADLTTLADVPISVVCAGVKSILDVPATLERLETLSITVVGYGTDAFPGFYIRDSGSPVPWRLDTADEIAAVVHQRRRLGINQALVVANPIPAVAEMDRALHDETLAAALGEIGAAGVTGKDVTPFLLGYFHDQTHGASLAANIALVLNNARLAADIAVLTSATGSRGGPAAANLGQYVDERPGAAQ